MHPKIQSRREAVATMNQRSALSSAEIFSAIGLDMSPPYCRFKVVPALVTGWHIQDSHTGKVLGFLFGHDKACALAQRLERLNEPVRNGVA